MPLQHRARELDGATAILEHRADQDVDIRPDGHLLCVNFQSQRDATYAYAGERPWQGTRHAGMAHLIEPEHHIIGFVREPTDHIVLLFEKDWLSRLALQSVGAVRFNLVSNGVPYHDRQLRRLSEAMRDELAGAADRLMLDALTTAAGLHLLRTTSDLGATAVEQRHALSPRKLNQVREAIEANLTSGVRLADLAQLVDLSPDHLWRCFKHETGQTPHQYQTQRRAERVRDILGDPDVTLAQASERAGFSSQSHMTRVFQRAFGVTPGRWRQMRR